MVIGALALTGCSPGQTVTPTTSSMSTITQAVVPTTNQPNTAVVTGKLFPCTGEPTPLPGTIFNSVDLDTTATQVVAPAPVSQDDTYRFTDVIPGQYELTEGPTGSPQIIQPISVRSSQMLVVDLPSCPPTVGGSYKLASAKAVHRFLAEAQSNNQRFVATYRTFDSDVGPELPFTPNSLRVGLRMEGLGPHTGPATSFSSLAMATRPSGSSSAIAETTYASKRLSEEDGPARDPTTGSAASATST